MRAQPSGQHGAAPAAGDRRDVADALGGWLLRLPRLGLLALLRAYQLVLSPLTGATCRYYPSCSAYAIGAIRRFGVLRGAVLTAWRLLRCNPWSLGGVDHVPRQFTDAFHRSSGPITPRLGHGAQHCKEQPA